MITSAIILLLVALCLWGIYAMAGRALNGVPLAVIGIILILIFMAVGIWLFGGSRRSLVGLPVARETVTSI